MAKHVNAYRIVLIPSGVDVAVVLARSISAAEVPGLVELSAVSMQEGGLLVGVGSSVHEVVQAVE